MAQREMKRKINEKLTDQDRWRTGDSEVVYLWGRFSAIDAYTKILSLALFFT